MHPTLRLALALIAGIAAALITIMVIETVGHSMYPPPALDYNDTEALRAYVDGLPLGAKLIVLAAWLAGTIDGVFVAGLVNRGRFGLCAAVIGGLVLAPLVYGLGFGAAAWLDPLIDRHGPRQVAPVVFAILVLVYGALALGAGSAVALIALCLVWGAVNHLGLNLIVGRLAGLDPARRGAILGLNSGVTYSALFTGTWLFGLGYARLGFAFCALLSALCILPALVEARRLRRRSAGGAATV